MKIEKLRVESGKSRPPVRPRVFSDDPSVAKSYAEYLRWWYVYDVMNGVHVLSHKYLKI